MKNRRPMKSKRILLLPALFAVALVFHLGASGGFAADTDGDGYDEVAGIILPGNMRLVPDGETFLPNCYDQPNVPRNKCVREGEKDLFVVMKRASIGGIIPKPPYGLVAPDPLALVPAGLGVVLHELEFTGSDFSQKIENNYAVMVDEDLGSLGNLMGLATFGAPFSGSIATVWPFTIEKWLAEKCSEACFTDRNGNETCYTPSSANSFICKNAVSGTTVDMKKSADLTKLINEFIQNIVSHEVGHMIHLAVGADTFDHHYPTAKGVLMEQFIDSKATNSKGKIVVNLYISTSYTRTDSSEFIVYDPYWW